VERGFTAVPVVEAISLRDLKTPGTVRGEGLNIVGWAPLDFWVSFPEGGYLSDISEVSCFLEFVLDLCYTASCTFRDCFDEKTFADAEFETFVVWSDAVDCEVNHLQKIVRGNFNDRAIEFSEVRENFQTLCGAGYGVEGCAERGIGDRGARSPGGFGRSPVCSELEKME
jgi:hypothetical protein